MTLSIVPNVVKSYKGRAIRIREDKYVCLSDMATANGKLLANWTRLKSTSAYLTAFSGAIQICIGSLLEVENGITTWAHPKVAIRFAQWCNPEFAIQVDFWVDELMTTGSVSIASKPKTALELAKDQVKLLEQIELQAEQILLLEEATERQAEIIDELFDYSSIIRIAKYNRCSETNFKWSKLKSASKLLGVEIKKAPCPRFDTKNLYSHDAWRLAYPGVSLPETTTLTIQAA